MNYLLAQKSLPLLNELARRQTLCAFDFDGTLAPIVEHPDRARMRGATRTLLRRVAALYPSIVVSGRSRDDVLGRLRGIPLAGVFGNHGAEADSARSEDRRIRRWKNTLQAALGTLPGVWVEDKGASLAVHYRQSPRPEFSRRRIAEAIAKLEDVRTVGGKKVINLIANGAATKGDAVLAARDRLGCNWILFVGDDDNDEDAFALGGNLVAVRIGRKKHTRAQYFLRSQAEIDQLLFLIVRLRAAELSSAPGARALGVRRAAASGRNR